MRVISGAARGKRLVGFSGSAIRPTPDKVRGAVFSMLLSRIGSFSGKKILDLCSGTGAMAIEALSRGAAYAWMIDEGAQSAQIIPANLTACGFSDQATFIQCSAIQGLERLVGQRPFDLVFLDPPYGKELGPVLLGHLAAGEFLSNYGIICIETSTKDQLPERVGPLFQTTFRSYGKTTIHLYIPSETRAFAQ